MAKDMMKIDVAFFGAFKAHGKSCVLTLPPTCSVADVKNALIKFLGADSALLVHDSVLANGKSILSNDHILTNEHELAILPPVCGG